MSDSTKLRSKAKSEQYLWNAINELRNFGLRPSEYLEPILGLIFLYYLELRVAKSKANYVNGEAINELLEQEDSQFKRDIHLPDEGRFSKLLTLPIEENIGEAINKAMRAVELQNQELSNALPKSYNSLDDSLLRRLIKNLSSVGIEEDVNVSGVIYESILNEFAVAQGRAGGEFFTPVSLTKLMVEIIEPYHGKVYDPACGSGGMFIQAAKFSEQHHKNTSVGISIFGQDKVKTTVDLCKMNLAVHGLLGNIKQGNTFYEDLHESTGKFDFVISNPPFNVDGVDTLRLESDLRVLELGIPKVNNANYLWINFFYSALNEEGKAAFIMASSAGESKGSELTTRKKLIQTGAVDVVIQLSSNFFYSTALPCTLWFLDKRKASTKRRDEILFIDARQVFRQVNRTLRDFSADQIEYLTGIVQLYRGKVENSYLADKEVFKETFPDGKYSDIPGLCKVATIAEIEEQEWSLNPSRYCNSFIKINLFDFLEEEAQRALENMEEVSGLSVEILEKIDSICTASIKAPIRLLLSCLIAKIDKPLIDIRKPYPNKNNPQSYSGRTYDEIYISPFVTKHRLPCGSTTAFLNPLYRRLDEITIEKIRQVNSVKFLELYEITAELLNLVQYRQLSAKEILYEVIRKLFTYRNHQSEAEKKRRQLENCPYGRDASSRYENIGTEILEYIFSSELERVKVQATTKDGTQRRDVIFKNKETSLFWQRISRKYGADFITVDFKNYQEPITSEVVESVTKYANNMVGNFIAIVSRKGISESAIKTQLRILRDRNIAVIVMSDENLIQMMELKESSKQPEKILEDLLTELIVSY